MLGYQCADAEKRWCDKAFTIDDTSRVDIEEHSVEFVLANIELNQKML